MKQLTMPSTRDNQQGPTEAMFMPLPRSTLAGRLVRIVAETGRQFGRAPLRYLSAAFLPDRTNDWFPIRLATRVGRAIAHPGEFLDDAAATDEIGRKRRGRFVPVLAASAAVHGVLIVYLTYLALFSQFSGLSVVNRGYRKFDPNQISGKLYYPTQIIRQHELDNLMKLEEIRKRDEQRREEYLRQKREREEQERKAKEEAERKAKEEQALAKESADKQKSNTKFGEINEAPIKDMMGELYELYKAGELELGEDLNFTMMATFKIEADGSISGMRMVKPSPSKKVDLKALEILHLIGESHALGPLRDLTSGSVKLDLNENTARLTITAFAPTADDAKSKAELLNLLFFALRMKGGNSADISELLSMIRVRADNKRLDADLTVPRARANAMFKNKFAGNSPQPQ